MLLVMPDIACFTKLLTGMAPPISSAVLCANDKQIQQGAGPHSPVSLPCLAESPGSFKNEYEGPQLEWAGVVGLRLAFPLTGVRASQTNAVLMTQ